MAREVRGIRQSLVEIGLPETSLPEAGSLQNYVEAANFARLAMAVEDHRSMLRKVPLKPPMLYFYISSDYGWRKHPVLNKQRFHHGIDLAGTWQETVHAPAPGTVIFAGRKGSFGKVVQVRHFSVVCEEGERALFGVAALGIFENVLDPGLRAGQSEAPSAQTGTRSRGIARGSEQVDRSRAAKPG